MGKWLTDEQARMWAQELSSLTKREYLDYEVLNAGTMAYRRTWARLIEDGFSYPLDKFGLETELKIYDDELNKEWDRRKLPDYLWPTGFHGDRKED